MRKIVKEQEPSAWTAFRTTPGVTKYQRIPELAEALLNEQKYVCAYCETRISLEKSRIEHIKARSIHPNLQLDYTNMVICCEGGTKNGGIHCDNAKGNKEVSFDLFGDALFESISYSTRGEIKSSNSDWSREINDVLNLNAPLICINREQASTAVLSNLRGLNPTEKRRAIKAYKDKIKQGDAEGKYPPYGSYILYMLERLERRLQ